MTSPDMLALDMGHSFVQAILDNPEMLARFEAYFKVKGKNAVLRHTRFQNLVKRIAVLIKKFLETDDADIKKTARRQAELHVEGEVETALFIQACIYLEDIAYEKASDLFPCFLKNIRRLKVAVTRHYDSILRKTRKELEETSRYWREIFDGAAEGMAVFSINGNIRYYEVDRSYLKLIGYTKEELLNPHFDFWCTIDTKYISRVKDVIYELISTKRPQRLEIVHINKNGTRVPVLLAITKLTRQTNWDKERILITATDIKEIKEHQQKLVEILEFQKQTIKELQTPVIPIWESILMTPLVGSFDSARMNDLNERVLEAVSKEKPKKAIIDLTGLTHVDTNIVGALVKLVSSLRLLGTRTILVGINPQVAQQLTHIGANMEGIPTYATLEQGLKGAIS